MALTVSSITAEFMKDTKTIGALNSLHPSFWLWRKTASAAALSGSHHPSRGSCIWLFNICQGSALAES